MLGDPRETTAAIPAWPGAEPRPRVRLGADALVVALAGLALATVLWLGLWGAKPADWASEAYPSVDALLAGRVGEFLQRAPAYGGSLLLRFPFMALARLRAGGSTAVYVAGTLPCAAALTALGLRLATRARGLLARGTTVLICVANPITIAALRQGHPEELLGAALCVAAVLCAQRERAVLSGVLVGVATANKPWGVLAAGPVLLVLPRDRTQAVIAMVATAGLILAPFAVVRSSGLIAQSRAVGLGTGTIFTPWQLWWFFGSPAGGVTYAGRLGPAWLGGFGHTLPLAIMPPLVVGYAAVTRGQLTRRHDDVMLLLALLLLLRCVLDPWDNAYYPAPFLAALLAWETMAHERAPLLTVFASIATWFVFAGATEAFGPRWNLLAILSATMALAALGAIIRRLVTCAPTGDGAPQRQRAAT